MAGVVVSSGQDAKARKEWAVMIVFDNVFRVSALATTNPTPDNNNSLLLSAALSANSLYTLAAFIKFLRFLLFLGAVAFET